MTNHWIDIKNADVILVMGSNIAENHPIGMKWVMEAKEKRNAKLIVADPRFTRTAAVADLYVPLRPGTDIAVYGGLINYILENNLYFEDYVVEYTNASFLVNPDFKLPNDLDGLFSGFDPKTRKYDKATWAYQKDEKGVVLKDKTLQDPNCVFQLLKKHYSRYTVDMVSKISGTPKEKLLKLYKLYASTGKPDKAAVILYAMGATQHTVGTQYIRAMTIIQFLLGNVGIAGGGIGALRGESNVQGSTDHGLLFHIYPGYLKTVNSTFKDLKTYLEKSTPKYADPKSVNWWSNYPKYFVSLLKAFYGDNATEKNDFGFNYLPKAEDGKNYSWLYLFDAMSKGEIKGFFAWGQNPACSGANSNKVRNALTKLDWMVAVNIFDNETASFWRGPGMNPKDINTEVFLLPCAVFSEKEGSVTNSGRWAQWRYKANDAPGEAKPDAEIINELFIKIRNLYKKEGGKFPAPILNLNWNYGKDKVDIHSVAKEINGYWTKDKEIEDKAKGTKTVYKKGTQVTAFPLLQADGSTACGNWLYCQSYNDKGNNMAKRDDTDNSGIGLYSNYAWAWPVNRRILYNRASVDLDGEPLDPERAVIQWDGKKWVGDVPDGPAPPLSDEKAGKYPFIMKVEGVGAIFGPGLADGPFPEHYEPLECPVERNLMSKQKVNPVAKVFDQKALKDVFASCDPRFPHVATTYRVTEHWQTGVMTRRLPWLLELQPQLFVEIGKELAEIKKIKSGDKVKVSTIRGEVTGIAIVTSRIPVYMLGEQKVFMIGLPWCYGWLTPKDAGDSANLLTPSAGDANTAIPESKAFMANVEKV